VPIVSIGYVDARGGVGVRWHPPDQRELVAIPPELLFHDPKIEADGEQESEAAQIIITAKPVALIQSAVENGWQSVSKPLQGAKIYSGTNPVARFQIKKSGMVYLACHFGYEGNSSGGWKEQTLSTDQFQQQGWIPVTDLLAGNGRVFLVFRRMCSKGESFQLRCNKYTEPLVILADNLPAEFDWKTTGF